MENVTLNVKGMKCGGCENTVQNSLKAIAGVATVIARHKEATVEISFDPAQTSLKTLQDTITQAGFTVT